MATSSADDHLLALSSPPRPLRSDANMIPWVLQFIRTQMTPTSLTILSNTNIKDHLFMSWQYYPPIRVPLTKTIRGITLICGYVYHWNNPHIAEQTAWGNTIDHDFYIGNLTPRATIWFYLWSAHGPYGRQIQGPLLVITLPPHPPDIIYETIWPIEASNNLLRAGIPRAYQASSFTPEQTGNPYFITVKLSVYDPLHEFAIRMELREGPDDEPPDDVLELSPTIITALQTDRLPYIFLFPAETMLQADTQYWVVLYRTKTAHPNVEFTTSGVADPYSGYNANGLRPWEFEISRIYFLIEGAFAPGPPPYDLAIGKPAIDRIGGFIATYTIINQAPLTTDEGDPPPSGGTIDKVSIWATEDLTFVRVGTFSRDGDNFTCRDSAFIGTVPWGSEQSFDGLGLIVEVGDHLGIYFTSGEIDVGPDPTCYVYYKAGNQFEEGEQHYDAFPDYAVSLHGEGWTFP